MGLQVFGWSTSALVTSHTGSLPRCGRVKRITVDHHCCPCFELRQPGRFYSSTLSAASAKVGMARDSAIEACRSQRTDHALIV
jgi:hypothetical protein